MLSPFCYISPTVFKWKYMFVFKFRPFFKNWILIESFDFFEITNQNACDPQFTSVSLYLLQFPFEFWINLFLFLTRLLPKSNQRISKFTKCSVCTIKLGFFKFKFKIIRTHFISPNNMCNRHVLMNVLTNVGSLSCRPMLLTVNRLNQYELTVNLWRFTFWTIKKEL